jgi:NDP-sugar pyrophosphorylase family protein
MSSLSGVTAVILAGGLGTRLRSVVADRPKVLAEIHGRPFLHYLLDQLDSVAISQAVLCVGYQGNQVQETLGTVYKNMRLSYSMESTPLGTGGAIRQALPYIASDTALVLNGDSQCRADLADFWNWHQAHGGDVSLVLAKMPDTSRFGRVVVDHQGRASRFEEKGGSSGPGWINAGIYLIRQERIQDIPAERSVSLEHDMFPAWLGRGLRGYKSSGDFLDIGTAESYAQAERFFPPPQ